MAKRLFTSESVTEGHPDKMCDQISDAILDAIIARDPMARVAVECMTTTGIVFVAGELTTTAYADIESIVRRTVRSIGYTKAEYGFDSESCAVVTAITGQSPDIARGVDAALETRGAEVQATGAGDQGMMFGYATSETETYMPMPIDFAHKLARRLSQARKSGELAYLRPDGKAQVTVEYEGAAPKRVECVVISTQHDPLAEHSLIGRDIKAKIIAPIIPESLIDAETKIFVNPTGRFVVGGPMGDCGLTGRKIIVDTYGGFARHGGGAFSGKDPTKVDRSAAYIARCAAKSVVASGLAGQCELQLAYAIGVSHPVSVSVNTFGTGKMADAQIEGIVKKSFDLTPDGIISYLDLRRPIYEKTAAYGHFGRDDISLPWEEAVGLNG